MNSAASRAYYAMFQAAQVALDVAGVGRRQWTHAAVQAALRRDLPDGFGARQAADYSDLGVSRIIAHRIVRRAAVFVATVAEATQHGR